VTLDGLLAEQGFIGLKVATALNGNFVPERDRKGAKLAGGDRIEVVSARQGG
jgi:sulfur carrier protein